MSILNRRKLCKFVTKCESIIHNHKFIDRRVKKELKKISNGKYRLFKAKDIINIGGRNDCLSLHNYNDGSGIYIFFDDNFNPVYIGVAKNDDHSLKERICTHLKADHSNSISKNIYQIEQLIGNIETINTDDRDKLKKLLLKYAPFFMVIPIDDSSTAIDTESVLIALLELKYNK